MNRRFRMLSLISEALELEAEETAEKDEEYEEIFRKDFAEVNAFLIEKQERKTEKITAQKLSPNQESPRDMEYEEKTTITSLKKIYRALARKTHPDLAGAEKEDEFKDIQNAFNNNQVSKILAAANRNDISAELSEEEVEELRYFIKLQKQQIREVKQTVRWAWARSDRDQETRRRCMLSMGVNPTEFYSWIEAKESEKSAQVLLKQRQAQQTRKEKVRKSRTQSGSRNSARQRDLNRQKKKSKR